MKKSIKIAVFSFLAILTSSVFAGNEDWNGTFTLLNSKGSNVTISHTPTAVHLLFMTIGSSFSFSKNSSINDLVATEDGEVGVAMNADEFITQIKKLGTLVDQQVTYGSTYTV